MQHITKYLFRLIFLSFWLFMSFKIKHYIGPTAVVGEISYMDSFSVGLWHNSILSSIYFLSWLMASLAIMLAPGFKIGLWCTVAYLGYQLLIVIQTRLELIINWPNFIFREYLFFLMFGIYLVLEKRIVSKLHNKAFNRSPHSGGA